MNVPFHTEAPQVQRDFCNLPWRPSQEGGERRLFLLYLTTSLLLSEIPSTERDRSVCLDSHPVRRARSEKPHG